MLSIGEFAHRTRVSRRTLRHWDAEGILKPAVVDQDTGYRWYAPSQAGRAHRIVALRSLGFGLEQIASMLDSSLTAARLLELLRTRENELDQRIRDDTVNLTEIRQRVRSIEKGISMTSDTLQLVPLPALHLARVATQVSDESEIGHVVGDLADTLRKRLAVLGDQVPGPTSTQVRTYYGPPDGGPLEVSVAIEVPSDFPAVEGIELVTLPAVDRGAAATFAAATDIGDAWFSIDATLESYGLATTGVHRHLRHHEPDGELLNVLQAPVEVSTARAG